MLRSGWWSCIDVKSPVVYLGVPAPGDNDRLGAPTQSVRGSTDAKNELGVKERRKLSRASHIVVSRVD